MCPQPRLRSTPGKHRGGIGDRVELLSPGSGDDKELPSTGSPTEIKGELSTLLSPVLDVSTSPGEEDYEDMSLGHIKMDGIDPSNILEPGTARTTRGMPLQRLRSTPGKHGGGSGEREELPSPGSGESEELPSIGSSPLIKVELSTLLSPVLDVSTSPGEEDYEETPVTAG